MSPEPLPAGLLKLIVNGRGVAGITDANGFRSALESVGQLSQASANCRRRPRSSCPRVDIETDSLSTTVRQFPFAGRSPGIASPKCRQVDNDRRGCTARVERRGTDHDLGQSVAVRKSAPTRHGGPEMGAGLLDRRGGENRLSSKASRTAAVDEDGGPGPRIRP